MPRKLRFKIKNWKLLLLGIALAAGFTYLGFWQLARAHEKQNLINSFTMRTQETPFTGKDLSTIKDWRFYRVELTGRFDNNHTILLDNKIYNSKIGYDVFTPFHADGMRLPVLVNRGFIPLGSTRQKLPSIQPIKGKTTIVGMINVPPLYVAFGKIHDSPTINWPLRVQFVNLPQLGVLLHESLYPYIVNIDPKDPSAFASEWKIVTMSPDRHLGYAVQWFALAATLLILSLALNRVK